MILARVQANGAHQFLMINQIENKIIKQEINNLKYLSVIAFAALAVVVVNKLDSMDSRDSSRQMLIQDEARKLLLVPHPMIFALSPIRPSGGLPR